MTRHPINAFFRNGQPVPLTGRDFIIRFNAGDDTHESNMAIVYLKSRGFITQEPTNDGPCYVLTDAGLHFARRELCIREGRV